MSDLVEFLLARIVEDEREAQLATRRAEDDHLWVVTGMDNAVGVDYMPARVLAECEAKRRIVEIHQVVFDDEYPELNPPACARCTPMTVAYPCDTLRLLALPYADHPDYREEWKP